MLKAGKCTTGNEEDVGRVNLQEISAGILPSGILGDVDHVALNNLQQRVLNTFSGNVSADRYIAAAASDFIRLVNVNDSSLASLNVLSRLQIQFEEDRFDILTDVASLGKTGSVGDNCGRVLL
jgi:hypothetical protein